MKNFKCKKCGKCCSNFLPLTKEEIERMKRIKEKENKRILEKDWYATCPFLNSKNECDIYEQRPFICRQYDCYKFENHIVDMKEFMKYEAEDFKLVDIRAEIFNNKGVNNE